MEPYSYFLPKSHLTDTANNGLLVKTHEPVFSHSFLDADTDDFRKVCECRCASENGKSILFGMKKYDKSILYKSYHFCQNELVLSKRRTFILDKDYEHTLYNYNEEICFLFRSELVVSSEVRSTSIYISYMILNDSNEWQLVENAIVLQYKHVVFFPNYFDIKQFF